MSQTHDTGKNIILLPSIKFWYDAWCAEKDLATLFLGLFQLVVNKDPIILDYTNNRRVPCYPMFVGQPKIGRRKCLKFFSIALFSLI